MEKNSLEFVNSLLKSLSKLDYIKPGEVPNIDLYMDQVTTFMDTHLSDVKRYTDDKILTKTMINNYAKNDLLPPPIKKKYSKDHIYILIFIYYFKNILSISDIEKLLKPLTNEFFGPDAAPPSLDTIYKEVYQLEKEQLTTLSKDIYREFKLSQAVFENVENENHQEFLQLFTFVALLSWDIYIKKNIIFGVLDKISEQTPKDKENGKSEEKPKAKNETKKRKQAGKEVKSPAASNVLPAGKSKTPVVSPQR